MNADTLYPLILRIGQGEGASCSRDEAFLCALSRGLIRWYGDVVIPTDKGKQFLFHYRCKVALAAILDESRPAVDPDIEEWLTKHEFAVKLGKPAGMWRITPRGRDWLSQMR